MKGVCVEKLPHHTDKCNTASGLQVFLRDDGTYDGYCFTCNTYVPDPYKDKPASYKPAVIKKSKEEVEKELKEIQECSAKDLPERKLRKESLEYFGVKIGLSEVDGTTPVTHYYPYTKDGEIVGYKVRLIENKRMWSVGNQSDVDLFGWEQAIEAGGKTLYITEGELDAISLYQIFKDKSKGTQYESYNPAVVSLAHGAGSASRDLAKLITKIRKFFKEVVLVFDMDDPGRKAVQDVSVIIPDAKVAELPAKDVNDCLKTGRGIACYNAVRFNAEKPKNTRIVSGNDLHERAKEPAQYGVSWPWKHITEATRGIRLGETIYIGAGQKQG